jgi:ABC-type bacteriocin/lantibiotic exporter with double-glycine peptidase domain
MKNKNNIGDNKIILSDLQTVDTLTNNLTYSSLKDNEYISSKLYTDISYEDVIIIKDDLDNFDILVETILNSNQSFHIDGRAGCGKTTLIKMLQKAMCSRNY